MTSNRRAFCICKGCYQEVCIVKNKQEDKTNIEVIAAEETHKSTVVSTDGIARKAWVHSASKLCSTWPRQQRHGCPESPKLQRASSPGFLCHHPFPQASSCHPFIENQIQIAQSHCDRYIERNGLKWVKQPTIRYLLNI